MECGRIPKCFDMHGNMFGQEETCAAYGSSYFQCFYFYSPTNTITLDETYFEQAMHTFFGSYIKIKEQEPHLKSLKNCDF